MVRLTLMRSTIAFFATLLAALAVSPLRADPVNWAATSNTAMAITGDIVLDDYSLTFAYEADRVGNWSGSGENVPGYVFKIDPPANPKLLNGNKLCAMPVTYVVTWSPGEGELASTSIRALKPQPAPTGCAPLISIKPSSNQDCASAAFTTAKVRRRSNRTWPSGAPATWRYSRIRSCRI